MKNEKDVPWYSEEAGFFGEYYYKTYSDILTGERTQKEVKFIDEILKLPRGAKILDLCCGYGRHSVELAKRGYKVTGQDLNSFFLDKAKELAAKEGVDVKWIKDDMRNINFENEFDAVLSIFTTIGYLGSDEEEQKVFNAVSGALKKGGRYIIDINNRDRSIKHFLTREHFNHSDGSVEVMDKKFDHITSSNEETRRLFYPGGIPQEIKYTIRMFTVPELVSMLKDAGLELIESYGDFDYVPISFTSNRYVLAAVKK